MKYHPDRNKDDADAEGKFKEAKEAYEVLSDADRRATYDQFGHEGLQNGAGAGAGGGFGAEGFGDIFGDMFGDIFGGGQAQPKPDVSAAPIWAMNCDLDLEHGR